MLELGIPPKLVRLTQTTMESTTAKVKIQNELSESFHIRNGLRQGYALACILFNIALEKIVREANINQCGNVFYKSVQILAYADDIDISSRSPNSLKEATTTLDKAARMMGLEINQAKTKYMICGTKKKYVENVFKVKHMTFERVNSFVYLGTLITADINVSAEINNRITLANFGMVNMLKAKNINRKHKVITYKTSLDVWGGNLVLNRAVELRLGVFERKILRIDGPICEEATCRSRYNEELCFLYDNDLVKTINITRLRWAGHSTNAR
jgi:sorting nexin-29